jgi:hypothetical protein
MKCDELKWKLCGCGKVVALLLGMQLGTQNGAVLCASGTVVWLCEGCGTVTGNTAGYTKWCCFVGEWDRGGQGRKYRQSPLLPEKIYLSPLQIKLGLMENFVNGMDKTGRGLLCVRNKLPNTSDAKIKEGIFIGPQIRELKEDKLFDEDLNETERNSWLLFKRICKDILGNHKTANCQDVVQDLLTSYKSTGC